MEWENYGDVNFSEEGGILLAPVKNHPDQFEFIEVRTDDESSHVKVGYTGIVYTKDWEAQKDEIAKFADLPAEASKEDFALAIIEYYGGYQLGGSPLIHDSVLNDCSEYPNHCGYLILHAELCEYLKDIGLKELVSEDPVAKFMKFDNVDLADYLEDYFNIRESSTFLNGDAERWEKTREIEQMLGTFEGLKKISADIKSDLASMSKKDELFERCFAFNKVLDIKIQKETELLKKTQNKKNNITEEFT